MSKHRYLGQPMSHYKHTYELTFCKIIDCECVAEATQPEWEPFIGELEIDVQSELVELGNHCFQLLPNSNL